MYIFYRVTHKFTIKKIGFFNIITFSYLLVKPLTWVYYEIWDLWKYQWLTMKDKSVNH